MKPFVSQFLASLTAVLLGLGILLAITIGIIASAISSATEKEEVEVASNSVLMLRMNRVLQDRAQDDPLQRLQGSPEAMDLTSTIKAVRKAKDDDKIKGIYMDLSTAGGGMASFQSLRDALVDFKESGKFIYAHSDILTERCYYLSSVADSIFMYPTGTMEWNGLVSNQFFLRGAFERWNMEPKVFKVGKYKSAAEMFTRKRFSEPNKRQLKAILDGFWTEMITDIGEARKLNPNLLDSLAANLAVVRPRQALQEHLIDGIMAPHQMDTLLKDKSGLGGDEELRLVKVKKYMKGDQSAEESENEIAVVYASGGIVYGETDNQGVIASRNLRETLRKVTANDDVKAVVLRVSSPGGSALASDLIASEIRQLREKKPIIASMGDVAASGGYYISAPCDDIVAEPTTITGSIGVIGLLLNSQDFFNKELGVTFDRVYSSNTEHADVGNPNRPMSKQEEQFIQANVDSIYEDFLQVVQRNRGFANTDSVHKIAQGRVWIGKDARDINLVDTLGGLDVAIAMAAQKAGLGTDYELAGYPEQKSSFERIADQLKGSKTAMTMQMMPRPMHQLMRTMVLNQDPRHAYTYMPWTMSIE
jgi:protease-4